MLKQQKTHVPIRMCSICRTRQEKSTLLRYTGISDAAEPILDETQKGLGRGVYVCNKAQCQDIFSKRVEKKKNRGISYER